MYEFITHTWNTVKGKCLHRCSYCYMKKNTKEQDDIHLDISEFKTDFGTDKFIFVGSGIDLFARDIPEDWIKRTLDYCHEANNSLFGNNIKYMFQSKNPKRIIDFLEHPVFKESVICTTIETNRWYPEIMNNCPKAEDRALAMEEIASRGFKTYVTIEPIMDFDLDEMIELIKRCHPIQVNIRKNTNEDVKLPEPTKPKTIQLIKAIREFSEVHIKDNLKKKK